MRLKVDSPSELSPDDTLILALRDSKQRSQQSPLDFWPPEVQDNKPVWFEATKLVVVCFSRNKKPYPIHFGICGPLLVLTLLPGTPFLYFSTLFEVPPVPRGPVFLAVPLSGTFLVPVAQQNQSQSMTQSSISAPALIRCTLSLVCIMATPCLLWLLMVGALVPRLLPDGLSMKYLLRSYAVLGRRVSGGGGHSDT